MRTTTTMAKETKVEGVPCLLTARQVAEALAISERQVWRLASAGSLPAPRRVGQRARWDAAELEAWWREQRDTR